VVRVPVLLNRGGGAVAADPAIGDKVRAALKRAGIDAEVELVAGGDCAIRCKAIAERGDALLIVGGGDGTIGSAASALIGSATRLGILPLGTLNHFARDLGLPADLEEAAAVIAGGHERRVDVAEMNGRIFINNSAIGLYPLMIVDRDLQRRRLGRSKRLAMIVASVRTLVRFNHQRLTLMLNDREGHAAGDRVLKEVAAAWQNALRTTDLLARIGGDEFVALLPMCGGGDMELVAERLRGAVTHGPGSGLGIVQWDGAESATELVRRADEALYADKARGASARLADPVRLAALSASGLLDARAQPELDEISRMVTWLLDVPVATVTLVDDHRQFFAGACGLTGQVAEDRETPLSKSFCQHAVSAGRPLIVADAREVPLLRDNPAIDELGVIAYAGIPLVDGSDNVLGVLCAVDHEPRAWSDDDIATLRRLAQRAIGELAPAGAAPRV